MFSLAETYTAKCHKGLYKRAVEKYKELKKDIHSQSLPEEVRREMTRTVKQANENFVGKLGK